MGNYEPRWLLLGSPFGTCELKVCFTSGQILRFLLFTFCPAHLTLRLLSTNHRDDYNTAPRWGEYKARIRLQRGLGGACMCGSWKAASVRWEANGLLFSSRQRSGTVSVLIKLMA